jgi:CheY-like chemotaxis protein
MIFLAFSFALHSLLRGYLVAPTLNRCPTLMPQPLQFSWSNSRILIADDEPDMREIFAAWFRQLGCIVTEAADGQEALDAVSRDRFDAIVTDVRMPRLDGVQLVRQLHRTGHYTPIVIFVSGFADLTLVDAFDLGVEAVMSKPCEKKDLIGAVQRSLLRRDLIFDPLTALPPPAPGNCIRESFSSSASASQVAFGRGGFSIDLSQQLFPDSTIGFSISFAHGALTHLAGSGVLRWYEAVSGGSRAGIEILHLDAESLVQYASYLKAFAPVSFIPKDCHSHFVTSASP